jgi:hypothetical protein
LRRQRRKAEEEELMREIDVELDFEEEDDEMIVDGRLLSNSQQSEQVLLYGKQ